MKYLITTTAILAVLVIILGACANAKSDRDLESIDAFIASQEAPESTRSSQNEITDKISEETTEAQTEANKEVESNDGYRSDSGGTDSNRDDADSGTGNDSGSAVEKVSTEELAEIVVNQGINGDERIAYLGDRYAEVQAYIDEHYKAEVPTYVYEEEVYAYQPDTGVYYSEGALTPDMGVNYYNGVMETYYNLDMSGVVDWMHSLGYEGDYWVRSDGVKMFGDYVMVAADYDYEPKGTITETSLGLGIVCDTGLGGWGWHDIAVDW